MGFGLGKAMGDVPVGGGFDSLSLGTDLETAAPNQFVIKKYQFFL